jgi:hypothetical protein
VIRRVGKNLGLLTTDAPLVSAELERDGRAVVRDALDADQVVGLAAELLDEFERSAAERTRTDRAEFRYEMLDRGPLSQRIVAHPRVLEVVEPLLGNDCHVIANTRGTTRRPSAVGRGTPTPGRPARPAYVSKDDPIPYPVFAIGAHILLRDCLAADGRALWSPATTAQGDCRHVSKRSIPS